MTQRGRALQRVAVAAALTVAAAGLVALLTATAPFHYLALKAYDTYLSRLPRQQDSRIVLVLIDERSRAAFPEPMILWNRHYADLFRGLAMGGARVVGVDVFFSIPVDEWLPGQDGILSRGFLEASSSAPIVLGYHHEDTGMGAAAEPAPVYMPAAALGRVGFLNLTQDRDDYIRRQQLWAPSPTGETYCFAVELAALFTGRDRSEIVGRLAPLLDQDRAIRIAYRGLGTFEAVSFADVLAATRRNDTAFLKSHLDGRAVLVGSNSVEDRHATPASWTKATRMIGVEIHANTLRTLLDDCPVVPLSAGWRMALLLLAVGAVCTAAVFGGPVAGLALAVALFAAVLVAGTRLMARSLFFSPVPILTGIPLVFAAAVWYRFALEDRDRRRLRRIFGQYVPDRVVDDILAGGLEQFAGRRVEITVLFSDVRNFTHISEELSPEALMAQLNEYFGAMTEVVVTQGGVVDKFIGDGLLALFGAPVRHEDHARRALYAARRMREVLSDLNRGWAERDSHQFRIGIGLHTGEVVVGNVGSERKIEYTALGDTVNVASRVESATKEFFRTSSACILISESTLRAIGEVPDAEDVGEQPLKGVSRAIRLFRVGSGRQATATAVLLLAALLGWGWAARAGQAPPGAPQAAAAPQADSAQAVGMITQVQGKVTLATPAAGGAPAGKPRVRPAMLADVLHEGSEVTAGPDGAASLLFCPRLLSIRLTPNSAVVFQGGEARTTGQVSTASVRFCSVPRAVVALASKQQVGAMSVRELQNELTILSPGVGTRTLPAPTFRWSELGGAKLYQVAVETRDGRRLWEASVTGTGIELPAGKALAAGETFRLRVAAMRGNEELASSAVAFQVLPEQEGRDYAEKFRHFRLAAGLASSGAGPRLQLAVLYEELQDFGAAVREYEEALKFGDSEFIRARLAALRR